MGGVGLSLACFFLVVCSFKIPKALTFTMSTMPMVLCVRVEIS